MDSTVSTVRHPPSAAPRPLPADDEVQIQRWFRVLLRGWGLLAVGVLLGAGLGLLASLRTRPSYEAVASVLLATPPDQTGLFTMPGIRTIFNSTSLAAELVDEFGLAQPPHSLTPETFLSSAVSIEEVLYTYLIRLRVRLSDPTLAASVAARLQEKLIERTTRLWNEGVHLKRVALERQLEQTRSGLEASEQRLLQFRRESGLDLALRDVERLFWGRVAGVQQRRQGSSDLLVPAPKGATDQVFAKALELGRLETELSVRRDLYADLAKRIEEARVMLAVTPAPLRVVDGPAVPRRPLPGSRPRTIAVGMLAGLVLAGAVVVAREWRTAQ